MGILNLLFRTKEENQDLVVEEPKCNNPCDYCGKERFGYQKQKKICGKKYHLKCMRKIRKDAKQQAFT